MVQLYRFTQLLITPLLALLLSPMLGFGQAQVVQTCSLEDFKIPNGHAVNLTNLPGASDPRFVFDSQGGTLTLYDDGTANITGLVHQRNQVNQQWKVDIWLLNAMDFASWTALGRKVKAEQGPINVINANSPDWTFFEMDDSRSMLTGMPGTFYDGDTLNLTHRPSDREFGFQMGIGANAKNAEDGLSGWFFYSGSYSGIGDVNVNRACDSVVTPVCDVDISNVEATCISDTSFEVTVTFTGTGNQFEITDNQGRSPLSGLSAGTYTFSSYPNNTSVEITVTDKSQNNCSDTAPSVSEDCEPDPVCDVAIDSLMATCIDDSTFEVKVLVSGTGNYTITDDQGSTAQSGPAGSYTFGPYANNTSVSFTAIDDADSSCVANAGPVSEDCAPDRVCDVVITDVQTSCISDTSFEAKVTVTGTGNYTVADDQGNNQKGGAGAYTFGPYANNLNVSFTATDMADSTCMASAGPVTEDCTPDTCAVAIDDLVAECASDTSFEVVVTFSGIGNNFTISDDQGTPPLTGLSPGVHRFGDYFNSTDVFITVSNPGFDSCTASLGPVTADCTPVPTCDIVIDTSYTQCIDDTTFEAVISFTGTGNFFQISDNQGTPGIGNLSAGTYSFGNYAIGTIVKLRVDDFAIFNCSQITGDLTNDCDTTGGGLTFAPAIDNLSSKISGNDIQLSWESQALDRGTYFEIEKKSGDGEYRKIGERSISDMDLFERAYYFTDFSTEVNQFLSYRIKQVRPGHHISFSKTLETIRLDENQLMIGEVYPNPSKGLSQIRLNAGSPHRIVCEVMDVKGSRVSVSTINTVVGPQELMIPAQGLRPGLYLVKLTFENRKVFVRKLILTE